MSGELPELPPEVKEHRIQDAFDYDVAFRIGFIGLGQAGSRLCETFYNLGYRRVGVINTAAADLATINDAIPKLDLGTQGAGQDPAKGRAALEGRREDARGLMLRALSDDLDYLFVCSAMGGGTGGGGTRILIDLARDYMTSINKSANHVGAVIALPIPYEGQRVMQNAVYAFREVWEAGPSPLIVVDNKRIATCFKPAASKTFDVCNAQAAQLFHLFNRLAAQHDGLVAFDPSELQHLLSLGLVTFGVSRIERFNNGADISDAVRRQLNDSVLAEVDVSGGKAAGCIFLGSDSILDQVPLDFLGEGWATLDRSLAEGSSVFRGVYPSERDELRCYTMLAGLPAPKQRIEEMLKVARLKAEPDWVDFLGIS